MSYEVDALRALMIPWGSSTFGVRFDLIVLAASTIVLVFIADWVYPRVVT